LIGVAGFKLYDIIWDLAFFIKQRKIYKKNQSAIIEANYSAALGALLFDVIAFVSLMAMWLLRNNPIGGYISPVVSIFAVVYLTVGCIKRIKTALNELTDKTLPEDQQMKILNTLTKHYDCYSRFHSISSRKSGEVTMVDIYLSFEKGTMVEDVANLQKQMQEELNSSLGNCIMNIIVKNE
jgi:divalent metal cation (Fe/Co/Zn/Cd) transporter